MKLYLCFADTSVRDEDIEKEINKHVGVPYTVIDVFLRRKESSVHLEWKLSNLVSFSIK